MSYFPGRDYPDREVWLKLRAPRISKFARLIHDSVKGPLVIGINQAKRVSDFMHSVNCGTKHPANHGSRREIVKQRHAYYARRAAA
jgi:hypothetical protein